MTHSKVLRLQRLDACCPMSDGGHLTALLAERLLQDQTNVLFVVDDECAHGLALSNQFSASVLRLVSGRS